MTTYVAQSSGLYTNNAVWNPNGVPSQNDTINIASYAITDQTIIQFIGNTINLGGASASSLILSNTNGTTAGFASSLDSATTLNASTPASTSNLTFAGALSNAGTINANATGGTFVVTGDALTLSGGGGVAGGQFINTGTVNVSNGDNVTFNLTGTQNISGGTVVAGTGAQAPYFQNANKVNVSGGTLRINGNVVTASVSGAAPQFNISGNGSLELNGTVAAGQTVNFLAPAAGGTNSDTLKLDNVAGFGGAVVGYGYGGDVIDFVGATATTPTFVNNTLTVTVGGTARSISLTPNSAIGVQLASDGAGGTKMTTVSAFTNNTVNLSTFRNDITLTPSTNGTGTQSQTVTAGGTTTSYLASNQVNFADGTVYYNAASTGGQADLLYSALLQRAPDAAGLGYFSSVLQGGQTTTQVAGTFINSAEYQARFGSQTSSAFVQNLYQSLLGRTADSGGLSFYSQQIDSGTQTRAQVAATFVTTPEVQAIQNAAGSSSGLANGVFAANQAAVAVQNDYQTAFGRSADAAGLGFWTGQLEAGLSQRDLLNTFINSAEFQGNAMAQSSIPGFVNAIQQNALGSPEPSGIAYWSQQLASGAAGKADVALAYANSSTLAARETSSITSHGIIHT